MVTQAAFVFSCAVDAMIEAEGMKAENEVARMDNRFPKFRQEDFDHLRDRMQNRIAEQYHT